MIGEFVICEEVIAGSTGTYTQLIPESIANNMIAEESISGDAPAIITPPPPGGVIPLRTLMGTGV